MANKYGLVDSGSFSITKDVEVFWSVRYNANIGYYLYIQNSKTMIIPAHNLSEEKGMTMMTLFYPKRRSKKQLQTAIDMSQERLKTLKESNADVKNRLRQIDFWNLKKKQAIVQAINEYFSSEDIEEKAKIYDDFRTGALFSQYDFSVNSYVAFYLRTNVDYFEKEFFKQDPELRNINLFTYDNAFYKVFDNFMNFLQTKNNENKFSLENVPL